MNDRSDKSVKTDENLKPFLGDATASDCQNDEFRFRLRFNSSPRPSFVMKCCQAAEQGRFPSLLSLLLSYLNEISLARREMTSIKTSR